MLPKIPFEDYSRTGKVEKDMIRRLKNGACCHWKPLLRRQQHNLNDIAVIDLQELHHPIQHADLARTGRKGSHPCIDNGTGVPISNGESMREGASNCKTALSAASRRRIRPLYSSVGSLYTNGLKARRVSRKGQTLALH
jgi:hypothetical protein